MPRCCTQRARRARAMHVARASLARSSASMMAAIPARWRCTGAPWPRGVGDSEGAVQSLRSSGAGGDALGRVSDRARACIGGAEERCALPGPSSRNERLTREQSRAGGRMRQARALPQRPPEPSHELQSCQSVPLWRTRIRVGPARVASSALTNIHLRARRRSSACPQPVQCNEMHLASPGLRPERSATSLVQLRRPMSRMASCGRKPAPLALAAVVHRSHLVPIAAPGGTETRLPHSSIVVGHRTRRSPTHCERGSEGSRAVQETSSVSGAGFPRAFSQWAPDHVRRPALFA